MPLTILLQSPLPVLITNFPVRRLYEVTTAYPPSPGSPILLSAPPASSVFYPVALPHLSCYYRTLCPCLHTFPSLIYCQNHLINLRHITDTKLCRLSGFTRFYKTNPIFVRISRMKVVIIGAGGHGRVVLDILRTNHQFEVVGFLDSNPAIHHSIVDGIEVLGDLSLIPSFADLGISGALVAIGDNRIRQTYAETLEKTGIGLISAIHPSSCIADSARIGKNVVICAGANICAHVAIEDSAILNTSCIIDHESRIGAASHICPGVRMAGHVVTEPAAFVGIGATLIQNITIGEAAVIGAGAVVINDVPAYATVVGVPARIVKQSHLSVANHDKKQPLATAPSLITRPYRRKPTPGKEFVLQS